MDNMQWDVAMNTETPAEGACLEAVESRMELANCINLGREWEQGFKSCVSLGETLLAEFKMNFGLFYETARIIWFVGYGVWN